jgi:hypothetical protein
MGRANRERQLLKCLDDAFRGVHPVTGLGRYAQTGWIEWRYSGRQNFWTYTDNEGHQAPVFHAGAGYPLNTYHYYTTLYDVYSGYMSFYIDGQLKDRLLRGWQPIVAELFGEIDTSASQMPGWNNYPMYVQDIAVWYGGAWQRPNLNVLSDHWGYFGVYRFGSGSGRTFAIWDKYCPD